MYRGSEGIGIMGILTEELLLSDCISEMKSEGKERRERRKN